MKSLLAAAAIALSSISPVFAQTGKTHTFVHSKTGRAIEYTSQINDILADRACERFMSNRWTVNEWTDALLNDYYEEHSDEPDPEIRANKAVLDTTDTLKFLMAEFDTRQSCRL